MTRKITSLTSFLSFIVLFATSIVLYFEPHGRVAFWADWRFLGLSKGGWDDIHITVGILFLASSLVHIWLNWKPVVAYMKNKARELVVFTPALVASLALTLFFTFGTLAGLPPMQQILDFSAYLKELHTEKYGNPPYGHAELSTIKKFCGYMELDPAETLEALKKSGLKVESVEQTLLEIAEANSISPADVFKTVRSGLSGRDPFSLMPKTAPEGTGKARLADICTSFGLPVDEVLKRLKAAGIEDAAPDKSIKEMASSKGLEPMEIYGIIRTGSPD